MIKNIIFDQGGVLIDLCRDRAVEGFVKLGFPQADEMLDPYKQSGIFLGIEQGSVSREEFYRHIQQRTTPPPTGEQIDAALNGFLIDIPEQKLDVLINLRKAGYRVYMLSNVNAIMQEYIDKKWFSAPGRTVGDLFDGRYLSFEMGITKPEPEIFREMVRSSGMVPGESLMIDDGAKNIETARELGFQTWHFNPGDGFGGLADFGIGY